MNDGNTMEFSPIKSKAAGCFIGAAIGDAMGALWIEQAAAANLPKISLSPTPRVHSATICCRAFLK